MATEFHTLMFVSRNKDNEGVEGFRPRCEQHVAKLEVESLDTLAAAARDKFGAMFDRFVSEGVAGETSRMYVTLNGRQQSMQPVPPLCRRHAACLR